MRKCSLTYFHLRTSEIRAAKGFSQAYILMIRIPDTTSFMVRILLSVSTAVLLLGGKPLEMGVQSVEAIG